MIESLCWMLLYWLVGVVAFFAVVEGVRSRLGRMKQPISSYRGFRVLITGASSGIGKELALQYAAKGCRLILAARRTQLLEEVRVECLQRGAAGVLLSPTDVTELEEVRAMVQLAADSWDGGIDLLVLNAGRSCVSEYANLAIGAGREGVELNVYGGRYPTDYALPHLRKAGGTILAISSLAGIGWSPMRTVYCASKHALYGFFNALRAEEPSVTVCLAYPGYVWSEIHDKAITQEGVKLERQVAQFMPTEVCVRSLIEGVHQGRRDIYPEPLRARAGRWLAALFPEIVDLVGAHASNSGIKKIPDPDAKPK